MSITYSLYFSSSDTADALLDALGHAPGYAASHGQPAAPGLAVIACRPADQGSRDIVADEFGFSPAWRVSFRWHAVDDPETTRLHLMQGCMALLRHATGDAALLHETDFAVFVRRQGVLLLNNDRQEGVWTPELLATLPQPWRIEVLPRL